MSQVGAHLLGRIEGIAEGVTRRVPIDHILELSAAERVAIVQAIWDSMLEHPEEVEITAVQREELDRRWEDMQQNPDDGEPWDDVKKSLRDE